MSKIRQYANEHGHEIIGKLTRRPEWEYIRDPITDKKKRSGDRCYSDEAGNEYIIAPKSGYICIIDADGVVI